MPWNDGSVVLEKLEGRSEVLLNGMPEIGRGFPEQWKSSDFGPLRELYTALKHVAAYTVIVYNHCQGIAAHSEATLTDTRNYVQHRLASVPAYPH